MATEETDFKVESEIVKVDEDQRLIYGWASVIEKDGHPVVDSQGDVIDSADLLSAVHEFITKSRNGGILHMQGANGALNAGNIVESIVFTHDLQKALGINLGKVGWFIGYHVTDDTVWKMAKAGTLPMFSIGGRGVREPM